MTVHADVDIVTERLAQRGQRLGRWTTLERRIPTVEKLFRRFYRAGVAVDANGVAHFATEQLVHRHPKRLALDVPQGGVQGADDPTAHRAGEPVAMEHVVDLEPKPLDIKGVLANQDGCHLLNPLLAYLGPAAPFSHAMYAGIGDDLAEYPVAASRTVCPALARRPRGLVGVYQERLDLGDFHPRSPSVWLKLIPSRSGAIVAHNASPAKQSCGLTRLVLT